MFIANTISRHQHVGIVVNVILIIAAIVIHNMIGLGSAYWLCKLLKYPEITARTIAIEVGMQNSGLSVALALKYFTISSALPGALFSIWHNISGSFLAAYWRDKT